MGVEPQNSNPIVYLEFKIQGHKGGRVVLELFPKCAPKTCENFQALCTGKGVNKVTGLPLCFKRSRIDRIIPNVLLQGGDVRNDDGSPGGTIYGPVYSEENYEAPADIQFSTMCGILALANTLQKPEENTSQFFITTDPCPHLEGTGIIFGKVLNGLDIIRDITCLEHRDASPVDNIEVSDCGEIRPGESFDNDGTADVYPPYPEEWTQGKNTDASEQAKKAVENIKDSGNLHFKRKDFYLAQRKYEKALRYILWAEKTSGSFEAGREQNTLCKLNLTAAKLSLKRYKDVQELCSELIKQNPNLAKAYFRRGQASFHLSDYKAALRDLKKAHELQPTDVVVRNEIKKVENAIYEYYKREKKMYASMLK